MIKIHRNNRVIFWLFFGGLILNILWSFRLELQAKDTKTLVEAYHYNLNQQNSDTLFGLKEVMRRADSISIKTNDQKMEIYMGNDPDELGIYAGASSIKMIPDKELIDIRHNNSILKIGKAPEGEGIAMGEKDSGSLIIRKDKGVGLVSAKKIILEVKGDDNRAFHLRMEPDKEFAEIRHQDSIFRVGKTPQGEGIAMGEKDSGTLIIRKDKGIGITTGVAQIILDRPGKGGNLSIWAEGDINIGSKNGVVRINGKKIHMNKEDSQSSGTSDTSSLENNFKQSSEKDLNSFNATKIMQSSLKSRGFYDGAVDGINGHDTTKGLQGFLRNEGFYQGSIDGYSGEALEDAIKQYQKSNGLKITGHINLETANAMQPQNIE